MRRRRAAVLLVALCVALLSDMSARCEQDDVEQEMEALPDWAKRCDHLQAIRAHANSLRPEPDATREQIDASQRAEDRYWRAYTVAHAHGDRCAVGPPPPPPPSPPPGALRFDGSRQPFPAD
jgi:hypothetical protein